jgi:two-component system NtrC family sensor kinase
VLQLRFPIDNPLAQIMIKRQQPIILSDLRSQEGTSLTKPIGPIASWMGVPLIVRDVLIGCLTLDSYQANSYDHVSAATAQALASHIAIAIRNAQVLAQRERALSDLQQAQQQLVQRERLSAVGELVAGVAHELNNPLTTVLGFATLLQETGGNEVQESVGMIVDGALRARRIVQNLLGFARQREAVFEPVQLNDLVRQSLYLREDAIRDSGVEMVSLCDPSLPITSADGMAIQQVLLNLLSNAVQALEHWDGERRVTITTGVLPLDANQGGATLPILQITVADTGPGISPNLRLRIFEPFFTTKSSDMGTGLGLSICANIARRHGGQLRLIDSPTGAWFRLELPAREVPPTASSPLLAPSPYGRGRVLVVEDDLAIRDLIVRVLTRSGIQTDTASDGTVALQQLRNTRYDAVVCDIKMPNLNGIQFYHMLNESLPELARSVVFISGDTVSPATREFLGQVQNNFLEKPFGTRELVAAVRSVMGRRATG